RHEPRSFQFPLIGIDQEKLEERREVLKIKTSEEPPAILDFGQSRYTIPTGELQLHEASDIHDIDTEGLVFTPYKDFRDYDVLSLMQVSEPSYKLHSKDMIETERTGDDFELPGEDFRFSENWSGIGITSEPTRN